MAEVSDSKKFIYQSVFYQWLKLLISILFLWRIGTLIESSIKNALSFKDLVSSAVFLMALIPFRGYLSLKGHQLSFKAIEPIKKELRTKLYQKLIALEGKHTFNVKTSEIIQVASEGIEGIEIYIGRFMPQLYYSLLAPLTLFAFIGSFSFKTALVLFVCVPLIPLSIIAFQKMAKRIMKKYWHSYTELGDDFLDNVQGLTTLKIYGVDESKHLEMNQKSQAFRKATMTLLSFQLNAIILMNGIAFGGAALAIFMSYQGYMSGALSLSQTFLIIMLGSEFFIPVRLLGSFFHVAMNSTTACEKLFHVLDLEVDNKANQPFSSNPECPALVFESVDFGYDGKPLIFKDFDFEIPTTGLIGIVGQSGLGKSTLASLILRKNSPLNGVIKIYGQDIQTLSHKALMDAVTFVGHDSLIFKGTIASNLRMADSSASDDRLWQILKAVHLDAFVKDEGGLNYPIETGGSNLSGGQRQRLAMGRALLSNAEVYIFDEATSNIDQESERIVMQQIDALSQKKPVIVISHKLSNVKDAQIICCVLEGERHAQGTHESLMATCDAYHQLYTKQQSFIQKKMEDKAIA